MFVLLLLTVSFLNAETFFIKSKQTEFYQVNVQVNGNDISDKLQTNSKVVLDEYLTESSNVLSVCYTYNPEQGIPNVKQLAKVELYNTKVSTKIRGLAHITNKKLIPEYISVSPQSRKFATQAQHCVTHNFEDYTQEQLVAMEKMFNPPATPSKTPQPVMEDNAEVLVDNNIQGPPEPSQQLEQQPEIQEQQMMPEPEMGKTVDIASENKKIDTTEDQAVSEPESAPVMANQNDVSAEEALSFIPEEDFVVPVPPSQSDNSVVSTSESVPPVETNMDMPGGGDNNEVAFEEVESKQFEGAMSAEDQAFLQDEGIVFEEFETNESEGQDRGVASDQQETSELSDEEFFNDLEL